MDNQTVILNLVGEEELIGEIIHNQSVNDQIKSKTTPFPIESNVSPLDAPLGSDEIRAILEGVTLYVELGTALLGFAKALIELLKERPDKKVILKNKSGETITEVSEKSKAEEVVKKIEDE